MAGEYGLQELKEYAQQGQAELENVISTLDNKAFTCTYYPSTDSLVSQGGCITQAPIQAANASILHISNVCPKVQQTVGDVLKSMGGIVATLFNQLKTAVSSISNALQNGELTIQFG